MNILFDFWGTKTYLSIISSTFLSYMPMLFSVVSMLLFLSYKMAEIRLGTYSKKGVPNPKMNRK